MKVIGHSTFNVATYGTTAPTSASTYETLTSDVAVHASIPSHRVFIHSVQVLLDAAAMAPPEATETAVVVTMCRGDSGEYAIFSQSIPIVIVSGSQYAEGHFVFDPPIPYVNLGLTAGELLYDPTGGSAEAAVGQPLYGFIHGAAGAHAARVIVYWERMMN